MIGIINKTVAHFVGNKTKGDGVRFSEKCTHIEGLHKDIENMLAKLFKAEGLHQLYFEPMLELNPMYVFLTNMFRIDADFISESQNMARYLYEKTIHPKVKEGDLWILYLNDCEIESRKVDAVCILKIDTKDSIFQFNKLKDELSVVKQEGFRINKIDKGCIVYNISPELGYLCSIIDTTSQKGDEAKFWMDDFLHARPIQDSFYKTKAITNAVITYIDSEVSKTFDVSKVEKASMINRALDVIKTSSEISLDGVKDEAFIDISIKKDFERFANKYQADNDIELATNFVLEKVVLKKIAQGSMTTIKLDKNFDIKVYGDSKYIEKGFDVDLGMNFYKLFFKKEK